MSLVADWFESVEFICFDFFQVCLPEENKNKYLKFRWATKDRRHMKNSMIDLNFCSIASPLFREVVHSYFCISTEVNKESWNGPIFRTVVPMDFCAQKVTSVLLQPQLIDIGQKATLHWNFFAMVVVNVKGLCVKMKMKPVLLMDHGISIPTPQSTLNTIKAKSIYRSRAVRCLQ